MISDMSESLVFPRKYLRFLKKQAPLGGPGPQKCVFGRNEALFRFPGPKTALWGPKCDLGAPCSKPFKKQTFWGVFWRPRGGKTGFGAKMGGFSPRNENLGKNHVLEPKSSLLRKTRKSARNVTFFALKRRPRKCPTTQEIQEPLKCPQMGKMNLFCFPQGKKNPPRIN